MAEIRRPATRIQQGKRTLFLTSLTVDHFLTEDFYRVDRLDVQKEEGMQRLLSESRAKRLGKDLVEADEQNEAFLPTSVFLATSGGISYDERTKELFFDMSPEHGVCPLDVVDGQHRIEGLKVAATQNERLRDFPIAVVIADDMRETEKMLQFLTVNTKQQSVDQGVAQHITARFTKLFEIESLSYLPDWLRREVEKGEDDQALAIARQLNNDPASPWHGKIQFAHEAKTKQHTITQKTFVGAIKRNLLNKFHPYNTLPLQSGDKRIAVLRNYWNAVDQIVVGSDDAPRLSGDDSVVYKYNGLQFFLLAFGPVLNSLARGREFTVDAFAQCLKDAQEYLPPGSAAIMSSDYWVTGGPASGLNMAGIRVLAADLTVAIGYADNDDVRI